jgi:adiponectin receptor
MNLGINTNKNARFTGQRKGMRTFPVDKVPSFCHCLFINSGYRDPNASFQDVFFSLFSFHNETMNIWSHLIGLISAVIAGYMVTQEILASDYAVTELFALGSFIISACICLFFSCLYHWFGCLSETCHESLLNLDLTGVGLLITGSFIPGIYYGFQCVEAAQTLHCILIGVVLLVGLYAPWITMEVYGKKMRPFVLASLVVIGLVPFSHWVLITPVLIRNKVMMGMAMMFFWYTVGFVVFVIRVPERLYPDSFLMTQVISSHAIWHVCILLGLFSWFIAMLKYRSLSEQYGCSLHESCDSGMWYY